MSTATNGSGQAATGLSPDAIKAMQDQAAVLGLNSPGAQLPTGTMDSTAGNTAGSYIPVANAQQTGQQTPLGGNSGNTSLLQILGLNKKSGSSA